MWGVIGWLWLCAEPQTAIIQPSPSAVNRPLNHFCILPDPLALRPSRWVVWFAWVLPALSNPVSLSIRPSQLCRKDTFCNQTHYQLVDAASSPQTPRRNLSVVPPKSRRAIQATHGVRTPVARKCLRNRVCVRLSALRGQTKTSALRF